MKQTRVPNLLKLEEVETPFCVGGLWAIPYWQVLPPQKFVMMFKADLFVKHVENGLWWKWAIQNIFAQYTSEEFSFCLFTAIYFVSFRSFWPQYLFLCDHYMLNCLEEGWNKPKRRQKFRLPYFPWQLLVQKISHFKVYNFSSLVKVELQEEWFTGHTSFFSSIKSEQN